MHFQCGSLKTISNVKSSRSGPPQITLFPPPRLFREALDLMALAVDRAYQIFIKIPRAGDNEEQFVGL